jgi:hypothetical protein
MVPMTIGPDRGTAELVGRKIMIWDDYTAPDAESQAVLDRQTMQT